MWITTIQRDTSRDSKAARATSKPTSIINIRKDNIIINKNSINRQVTDIFKKQSPINRKWKQKNAKIEETVIRRHQVTIAIQVWRVAKNITPIESIERVIKEAVQAVNIGEVDNAATQSINSKLNKFNKSTVDKTGLTVKKRQDLIINQIGRSDKIKPIEKHWNINFLAND